MNASDFFSFQGSMWFFFLHSFKVHLNELDVKPYIVHAGLWNALDKQVTAPITVSFTPLTLQSS